MPKLCTDNLPICLACQILPSILASFYKPLWLYWLVSVSGVSNLMNQFAWWDGWGSVENIKRSLLENQVPFCMIPDSVDS